MFRYFLALFFFQFAVGATLRGQVFLNGDASNSASIADGATLVIRLQDTSILDAPATVLSQTTIANMIRFPVTFQLDLPTASMRPGASYSLSARISNGDTLLYINDEQISVPSDSENSLTINIPVIKINPVTDDDEQMEWPELVGRPGNEVVEYIKKQTGLSNVFTILEGSPMTMDYRTDRVRVIVNRNGIVTQVPRTG